MDHLPLPFEPKSQIKVPLLLSDEKYEGDFRTYPERQEWGRKRTIAQWHAIFQAPKPEFVAHLERWLFFGFLRSVLGPLLEVSDFIDRTSSPPVLTTKRLPTIVKQWVKLQTGAGFDLNSVKALAGIMLHSRLCSSSGSKRKQPYALSREETLYEFIDRTEIQDPRRREMAMATTLMMEFIGGAIILPDMTRFNIPTTRWTSLSWSLLREDGWCPSEISMLFDRFNASALYFLHHLSRPRPDQNHEMIHFHKIPKLAQAKSAEHDSRTSLCTAFKCSFKQLHDETYKSEHTDGCPGFDDATADSHSPQCYPVSVKSDDLCRIIIERKKIPLIPLIDENNNDHSITLKESGPEVKYIAISHVWSDGLGNPKEMAIPRCQLLRLSNLIRGLPEYSNVTKFWLDTLCIPPDELCSQADQANLKNAQDLAIDRMRKTYEDAITVLVLDSWLLSDACKGRSDVENLMKIFSSHWNTRLWTYQEGALAKTLYFQFKDAAYSLDHGIQKISETDDPALEYSLKRQLIERNFDLRGFRELGPSLEQRLLSIATAASVRTTSVSSDEALCLAALLLHDGVEKIASTDKELRMQEFWRMLPTVPASVLFDLSPKLDVDGLRWAPCSFLRSEYSAPLNNLISNPKPATRTNRGLEVEYPGLVFASKLGFIGEEIHLRDENHTWYHIQCIIRESRYTVPYELPEGGKGQSISPAIAYNTHQVGFILRDLANEFPDLNADPEFHDKRRLIPPSMIVVVLVAINEEKDGIIYCRRLCGGHLKRLTQGSHANDINELEKIFSGEPTAHYGGSLAMDKRNGTIGCAISQTKPSDQRWCVD